MPRFAPERLASCFYETLVVRNIKRSNEESNRIGFPSSLDLGSRPIRTVALAGMDGSTVWLGRKEHAQAAEQYRIIRTRLVRSDEKLEILLVASPGPGDGKTITATNLAGIFALKDQERVLLLDGDMRRSNVARRLGIPGSLGFADVLEGRCEYNEAVVEVSQQPNLHILPAGKTRANPVELLTSEAWKRFITTLRASYRWIIVDSPPIASVADYELLEMSADAIVLIVRPDHTNRSALAGALQLVNKEKLVGAVLNGTQDWFGWKASDYYYYGG